jgi:hypothetical protein
MEFETRSSKCSIKNANNMFARDLLYVFIKQHVCKIPIICIQIVCFKFYNNPQNSSVDAPHLLGEGRSHTGKTINPPHGWGGFGFDRVRATLDATRQCQGVVLGFKDHTRDVWPMCVEPL